MATEMTTDPGRADATEIRSITRQELANIQDCRLTTRLVGRTFQSRDLRGFPFQGMMRDGVDFTDSDLAGAQFQEASLRGARLTYVKNLSTEALGGADLTGAHLPRGLRSFDGLNGVADASKNLQSVFRLILGLSAISLLTMCFFQEKPVANGEDVPFMGAKVSGIHFGWIAPLFLLILFTYMVTYLAEAWIRLSRLPAVFPDGTPLDRRAYSLSLNCLIRTYSCRLARTVVNSYEFCIAYFFMYGISLLTLFAFWFSYRSLDRWRLSWLQALRFSIAFQMTLYHVAISIVVLGEKGWRTEGTDWADAGGLPAHWLRRLNGCLIEVARMLTDEKKVRGRTLEGWRLVKVLAWPGVIVFAALLAFSPSPWHRSSPSARGADRTGHPVIQETGNASKLPSERLATSPSGDEATSTK